MAQPIKILVLDYFDMSDFFRNFSGKKEYSFEITTSLHKCFIYLATKKPDIILLPFIANEQEPEHDILTIAKINNIPFIVINPDATQEKVVKAVRDGAMDFVLTSVDSELFIKKINKVLTRRGKVPPSPGDVEQVDKESMTGIEKLLTLLDKAKEVKAMPYTVAKVVSLCSDTTSSAADIAQPIKSDPALSSSILKHSNSATIYRGAPKVQNLQDAIVRIGLEETKETCLVHAVYSLFEKKNKTFGFDRYQFWIHSLGTGIVAKWIAQKMNHDRSDTALLSGVLHDLGKMIMDDYFNADYDRIIRLAATQKRILFHVENEIIGANHSFIGGKIAENWNFPETIIYAIKNHHDYARSFPDGGATVNLATLVFISNYITKALRLGAGGDYFVTPVPDAIWTKLGFGSEIPDEFLQSLRGQLKHFYNFLQIPPKALPLNQTPKNQHMRILVMSNSPIANVYLRLYLTSRGYHFDVGGVDSVPEADYDLIIYDFIEELHPEEMEFMLKIAEEHKNAPALIIYSGVNDILVIQKIHKTTQSLSAPLDMFLVDQIIKNYDPEKKEFALILPKKS